MLLCMPLAYSTQRTDEALQQGRNRYPWLVVLWYDVIRVILSDMSSDLVGTSWIERLRKSTPSMTRQR